MTDRLQDLWRAIEDGSPIEHTSLVVPSLSFDREEIAKIAGAPFYEERLLFSLMRLRDPRARVVYVTSQPIHPEIVEYYLELLDGVSARSARQRLHLFCCYDASDQPLTEKILDRPRLMRRIRGALGDPRHAYLTCFNSTVLERELAERLEIPLNGVDPELLWLGSKSGSRKIFAEAGVDHPAGFEDLRTRAEIIDALAELWARRAATGERLRRAVVKLNESFAGAGNAVFHYPKSLPEDPKARRGMLGTALQNLHWSEPGIDREAYLRKFAEMGGIVEEMVDAEEVRSPSVQLRLLPTGELSLVSTHDQILGGDTGQSYAGCRFPADPAYRQTIQREAWKIGATLGRYGVVSRFAVDFVVTKSGDESWRAWAIEINLRMGGTTPPFMALRFLTDGRLDRETGHFHAPSGQRKFYRATDALSSQAYRGLLPEDLMDILDTHGLRFSTATQTGVLFHMIGALSEFGKVGVTCIGDTREEADELFRRTIEVLDGATDAGAHGGEPVFDTASLPME